VPAQKLTKVTNATEFRLRRRSTFADDLLAAMASLLSFRLRSRASLELEVIALRHQLSVLKRQRLGRARLFCADRLLWISLYRIWPQAINAVMLVKPTTVLQWHRRGFRLVWYRSGARQATPDDLRGSRFDPPNEYHKSALGRPSDSRRETCCGDPKSPPPLGAASRRTT
jgi:hypothetical protein